MARGGDLHDRPAELGHLRAHHLRELGGVRHVDLVEGDDPRARGEVGAQRGGVGGELGLERADVGHRVALGLERRAVDDVHEHRAALDVAQEVQPEALALAGAGDEAGDVGDRVRAAARRDHPEIGRQRRERVVGDLRLGRADGADQRRLAGARVADQPDVGHRAQLEHEVARLPRLAEQREARGLARRPGQGGVAQPAATAADRDEPGADAGEVADHLAVGVEHDRPLGHRELDVLGVGAVPEAPHARLPVAGHRVGPVVEVEQRVDAGIDHQHHVPAAPAVAAVRPAEGHELLPADRRAPVAAAPRRDVQRHVVDEPGHRVCGVLPETGGGDERKGRVRESRTHP